VINVCASVSICGNAQIKNTLFTLNQTKNASIEASNIL
jgi:hypothetical protein